MLLLDEPTEGIQPSIIKEMARTLRRIRDEKGLSIVVSEQVLSFALDIADRILVLEKGEIVAEELRESIDLALQVIRIGFRELGVAESAPYVISPAQPLGVAQGRARHR